MDLNVISLILAIIAIILAIYSVSRSAKLAKPETSSSPDNFTAKPLQLQAYERLVMLADRIAIPNLVSRLSQPGLDARQFQKILLENIRQEFEYNTSQQIYVSQTGWEAIKNLKEQNMLIINQVTNMLPATATGSDLGRRLLELIMAGENASLHDIVTEALNFEARKIMQ
jgi:hypothetical protein